MRDFNAKLSESETHTCSGHLLTYIARHILSYIFEKGILLYKLSRNLFNEAFLWLLLK